MTVTAVDERLLTPERLEELRVATAWDIGNAERERAIAAINWVFNSDGTIPERSMAQEAIHKINDPAFMSAYRANFPPSTAIALIDALEAARKEIAGLREGLGTDAARDVLAERQRQVTAEGWTPEHDDQHVEFEMASAAGVYALAAGTKDRRFIERGSYSNDYFEAALKLWPWDRSWWKPKDRRRDLVKAGALILAEIERLDRARILSAIQTSPEAGR